MTHIDGPNWAVYLTKAVGVITTSFPGRSCSVEAMSECPVFTQQAWTLVTDNVRLLGKQIKSVAT